MRLVVVESPFAGRHGAACRCLPCWFDVERNKRYARALLRESLLRGEAPIASHLLYTQERVLDDTVGAEREMGIEAGLLWGEKASATVVGSDLGTSRGMKAGIERANLAVRPVLHRTLGDKVPAPIEMPPGFEVSYDCEGVGFQIDSDCFDLSADEAEAFALALLWAAKEARR